MTGFRPPYHAQHKGMDSPEAAAQPPMSLGSRLLNVFAAPGELFSAVAQMRFSAANWLVPSALLSIVGIIATLVIFAQPALLQQIDETREKGMQAAVEKGKMSAEQVDQARQLFDQHGATIMRVAGSVWWLFAGFVIPLFWGSMAWLIGRWVFRSPFRYLRAMEVAGLSSMITMLGMVIGMFLAVGTGRLMGGPHLGFFLDEFDPTNRLHIAMIAVNAFAVWQMAILALGISRLIGRPFAPVAVVVYGVWIGFKGIAVLLGSVELAS